MNAQDNAPTLEEFEEVFMPLLSSKNCSFESIQQASRFLIYWSIKPESENTALMVMKSPQTNTKYYLLAAIILEFRIHQPYDPIYMRIDEVGNFLLSHIISNQNAFNELYYQRYISILADIALITQKPVSFPENTDIRVLCLFHNTIISHLDMPTLYGFFTHSIIDQYRQGLVESAFNFLKAAPVMPCIEWGKLMQIICLVDNVVIFEFKLDNPFTKIPEAIESYDILRPSMKEVLIYLLKKPFEFGFDIIEGEEFIFYSYIIGWCCRLTSFLLDDLYFDDLFEMWTELTQNEYIEAVLMHPQCCILLQSYLTAFNETIKAFINESRITIVVDMISHISDFLSECDINDSEMLKSFVCQFFNNIIEISESTMSKNVIFLNSIRTFFKMCPEVIITAFAEKMANPTDGFFFACSAFYKEYDLPPEMIVRIFDILFSSNVIISEYAFSFIRFHLSYLSPYFGKLQAMYMNCETGGRFFRSATGIFTGFIVDYPQNVGLIHPEVFKKIISILEDFEKGFANECFKASALCLLKLARIQCDNTEKVKTISFIQNAVFNLSQVTLRCASIGNPMTIEYLKTFTDAVSNLPNGHPELLSSDCACQILASLSNYPIPLREFQEVVATILFSLLQNKWFAHSMNVNIVNGDCISASSGISSNIACSIQNVVEVCFSNGIVVAEHFLLLTELFRIRQLRPSQIISNVLSLEAFQQLGDDNLLLEAVRHVEEIVIYCTSSESGGNSTYYRESFVFLYMPLSFIVAILSTNNVTTLESALTIVSCLLRVVENKPPEFNLVVLRTIIFGLLVVFESFNYEDAYQICQEIMHFPGSIDILNFIVQKAIAKCGFLQRFMQHIQLALSEFIQNPEESRMKLYQVFSWKNSLDDEKIECIRALIHTMD